MVIWVTDAFIRDVPGKHKDSKDFSSRAQKPVTAQRHADEELASVSDTIIQFRERMTNK